MYKQHVPLDTYKLRDQLTAADFGGRSFTDLNFDEELQLHKNLA